MGRFTTQDVLFGEMTNPNSLNQYVYGMDSPLTYTDPTGMCNRVGHAGHLVSTCGNAVDKGAGSNAALAGSDSDSGGGSGATGTTSATAGIPGGGEGTQQPQPNYPQDPPIAKSSPSWPWHGKGCISYRACNTDADGLFDDGPVWCGMNCRDGIVVNPEPLYVRGVLSFPGHGLRTPYRPRVEDAEAGMARCFLCRTKVRTYKGMSFWEALFATGATVGACVYGAAGSGSAGAAVGGPPGAIAGMTAGCFGGATAEYYFITNQYYEWQWRRIDD